MSNQAMLLQLSKAYKMFEDLQKSEILKFQVFVSKNVEYAGQSIGLILAGRFI